MKHAFFLKKPKSETETLIMFTSYFNDEKKQFKYSTGENINPSEWNFEQGAPITKGKDRNPDATTILAQLMRYTSVFETTESLCIKMNEAFTSQVLKNAFDNEFKKVYQKLDFFSVYDLYTSEKIGQKAWKLSTIKRYKNIKNHLIEFEKKKAEDPEFTKSIWGMTNWFYMKTKYWDDRKDVYPIGKIFDLRVLNQLPIK